jgi:hypothetical protein
LRNASSNPFDKRQAGFTIRATDRRAVRRSTGHRH